jgi:hypothetical protein
MENLSHMPKLNSNEMEDDSKRCIGKHLEVSRQGHEEVLQHLTGKTEENTKYQ